MNLKIHFIQEKLRYFIHCLHVKSEEKIILNTSLESLESKLYELCNKYDIWSDGDKYVEIENNVYNQLTSPINLFNNEDNAEWDQEYEEFYKYMNYQFNIIELFNSKCNE